MSQTTSLHVAGAIFIKDDKVLACRRAPHKSFPGLWEFPGGKVETGEKAFFALEREIREELGIECKALKTFDVSETNIGEITVKLETIICTLDSDQNLASTDHDEFRWLEIKDLNQVQWAEPDLPAVKKLSVVGD